MSSVGLFLIMIVGCVDLISSVEVQAHRIAGSVDRDAPENSRAAVLVARQVGAASVEFDVRRTADGHLVVCHGPELMDGVVVEDKTLHEARALFPLTNGEDIPLLEEIASLCQSHNLIMNIEIKGQLDGANPQFFDDVVHDVLRIVDRVGASSTARISSFDRQVLAKVRALNPRIPVGTLYNGGYVAEDGSIQRKRTPEDFASWLPRSEGVTDSVNLSTETITPAEAAAAHSAGLSVMAWFAGKPKLGWEDGPENFRFLIEDVNVDVICTNRPDVLVKTISEMRS